MDTELSAFIGAMIGTAVGDSLGVRREGSSAFREIKDIAQKYSDDTAMMIGVAESLIECRGFDGSHMARTFTGNYEKEPWRGYGAGPQRIFKMIRAGRKWYEKLDKELYPGGSYGNGAAMRAAPIGLFYNDNPEKVREVAYGSGGITHNHALALEGAAIIAYAVARMAHVEPLNVRKHEFIEELKRFTHYDLYRKKLGIAHKLLDTGAERYEVVRQLGNGIEAYNSVPTAVYAFLANLDFESSAIYAVSLGGDADTIGAMTGAIAGACYGIGEIPGRWRVAVENGEYVERLARKLWEARRAVAVG